MGFGVSIATVGSLVPSRRDVGRTKNLRSEGVVVLGTLNDAPRSCPSSPHFQTRAGMKRDAPEGADASAAPAELYAPAWKAPRVDSFASDPAPAPGVPVAATEARPIARAFEPDDGTPTTDDDPTAAPSAVSPSPAAPARRPATVSGAPPEAASVPSASVPSAPTAPVPAPPPPAPAPASATSPPAEALCDAPPRSSPPESTRAAAAPPSSALPAASDAALPAPGRAAPAGPPPAVPPLTTY